MERRLNTRQKAVTRVYLRIPGGKLRRCKTANLSPAGVFVEADTLGVPRGQLVDLIFVLGLQPVIKIKRRKAIVAHVSGRGAGMTIDSPEHFRFAASSTANSKDRRLI